MKAESYKLLAGSGWYRVASTDAVTHATCRHYGLVAREDTVIAAWTMVDAEGGTRDLVAHFGISGATVSTDDPAMIVPTAWTTGNQSIQLTSGSVDLLRTS